MVVFHVSTFILQFQQAQLAGSKLHRNVETETKKILVLRVRWYKVALT